MVPDDRNRRTKWWKHFRWRWLKSEPIWSEIGTSQFLLDLHYFHFFKLWGTGVIHFRNRLSWIWTWSIPIEIHSLRRWKRARSENEVSVLKLDSQHTIAASTLTTSLISITCICIISSFCSSSFPISSTWNCRFPNWNSIKQFSKFANLEFQVTSFERFLNSENLHSNQKTTAPQTRTKDNAAVVNNTSKKRKYYLYLLYRKSFCCHGVLEKKHFMYFSFGENNISFLLLISYIEIFNSIRESLYEILDLNF